MNINERIEKELKETQCDSDVIFEFPLKKGVKNSENKKKIYICTCCGKEYATQATHFMKSNSPLYQANNNYVTICNTCRNGYTEKLFEFYKGNLTQTIRHLCQNFDILFSVKALTEIMEGETCNSNLIPKYLRNISLQQHRKEMGSTYIDSIKFEQNKRDNQIINSEEDVRNKDVNVKMSSIEKWGVGLTQSDYENLNIHYKMLKKNNPNTDFNQEIFIKDLCNIDLLKHKAFVEGDIDKFNKLVDRYAKTFSQAGLRTVKEDEEKKDITFGVGLSLISKYTPEEFYKDKKLYKDFDGIGEYMERHIYRPLRNLVTGDDVRDIEHSVPDNVEE